MVQSVCTPETRVCLRGCTVTCFVSPADDEINLLVIVVDVNPIWWGQQAQREPEVMLNIFTVFVYCIEVSKT